MNSFGKLIKHPHRAVFDTSANKMQAFTIGRVGLISWQVSEYTLTVISENVSAFLLDVGSSVFLDVGSGVLLNVGSSEDTGFNNGVVTLNTDGTISIVYDFSDLTVDELIALLAADGFVINYQLDNELLVLRAFVLFDQSGISGDGVFAYTSLLWVILKAYAVEVDVAKLETLNCLAQMDMNTAATEWLDVWGTILGVGRLSGQLDPAYIADIKKNVFRQRLNKYAIELAVLEDTGKVIEIEEFYVNLFRLDISRLSSSSRFGDGKTVGAFLIRAVSSVVIDWTDVMAVIHRNRAAGIVVLPPIVRAE